MPLLAALQHGGHCRLHIVLLVADALTSWRTPIWLPVSLFVLLLPVLLQLSEASAIAIAIPTSSCNSFHGTSILLLLFLVVALTMTRLLASQLLESMAV